MFAGGVEVAEPAEGLQGAGFANRVAVHRSRGFDEDATAALDIDLEMVAVEQIHSDEWHCVCFVHMDVHHASRPADSRGIDVKVDSAAIPQCRPADADPLQSQSGV